MNDKIIYGKNNETNIVSVEPKDNSCVIYFEKNGIVESKTVPHKYWLLMSTKSTRNVELKGNLYYNYGIQFNTEKEYKNFIKYNSGDNQIFYNIKEAFLIKDGYTYFKGMNPKDVSVLSFDLETTTLDPKQNNSKIILISTTYRNINKIEKKLFVYNNYNTQGEMIVDFCNHVQKLNPSILIGHNILGFDLQYLKIIAEKEGVSLRLGRDGSEVFFNNKESRFRKEANQHIHYFKANIYGREIVDTLFLSIRYDASKRKYTNYGLKTIIKEEGLEKTNRIFYDSSLIRHNYTNPTEFEKIKQYCVDDSDDSLVLYDLMIPPFFYMAQSIPKPFQELISSASGSQLNSLLCRAYIQDGHSIPKGDNKVAFHGAISFGVPGLYKNCLKWDVSSLYPSIMIAYNITITNKDPKNYFQYILKFFTKERLNNKKFYSETKNPYYEHLSNSQKILINSLYGFLGAEKLNFNCPTSAAMVTKHGREILQKAIMWASGDTLESLGIVQEEEENVSE